MLHSCHNSLFQTRNNGSIGRDTVIRLVGGVVRELAGEGPSLQSVPVFNKHPGETSVDLKAPEVAIVVEIIRSGRPRTSQDLFIVYLVPVRSLHQNVDNFLYLVKDHKN